MFVKQLYEILWTKKDRYMYLIKITTSFMKKMFLNHEDKYRLNLIILSQIHNHIIVNIFLEIHPL